MRAINYKVINLLKLLFIFSFLVLSACSNIDIIPNKTDYFSDAMEKKGNKPAARTTISDRFEGLFDGKSFDNRSKNITYEVALDQFSIMPLLAADSNGGTIITDWYSVSSNLNERVKFNIFIKDDEMSKDSIEIKMFKEIFNGSIWTKASVNQNTALEIKKIILDRAARLKTTIELS